MCVFWLSHLRDCPARRELGLAGCRSARYGASVFCSVVLLSGRGHGQEAKAVASVAVEEPSVASTLSARVVNRLVMDDFMDVAAVQEGSRVSIRFQNTRYRDRRRALDVAAALAQAELGAEHELVLVPTQAGIPLLTAIYAPAVPAENGRRPLYRISMRTAGFPPEPTTRSPHGRLDVVIHPWFEGKFSNTDPVASRTGIAPELRMSLRTGLTVSAQALFTLHDDIPTGESRVRPGLLTLNQRLRLWDVIWVSATAGTFNPDRYGIDVEARVYSPGGGLSAGAEVALTGAASYGARDWYFASMKDPMALADVAWRELAHGLTVRMTGGWFAPAQPALRLDVSRQWGTTEVGFFAVQGETEANFGFRLIVPLVGAHYGRLTRFRARSAETFPWEYRYHTRSVGGRMFRMGNTIDDEVRQWMAQ